MDSLSYAPYLPTPFGAFTAPHGRTLSEASVIGTLLNRLRAHDPSTARHAVRVCDLSRRLALRLGFNEKAELEALRVGTLLHDIGKLDIPQRLLCKRGALSQSERWIIEQHSVRGQELLRDYSLSTRSVQIVVYHHERWDGAGYPFGLAGSAIPELVRIVAVADCFDAMTARRPYRQPLSKEQAVDILRQEAGRQFDPAVVGAMQSLR